MARAMVAAGLVLSWAGVVGAYFISTGPQARLFSVSRINHSSPADLGKPSRKPPIALWMSESDEDYPSDTGDDRFSETATLVEDARSSFGSSDTPAVTEFKMDLLRLAALTGRKATEGISDPRASQRGGIAASVFAITDTLPGKGVGEAVQTITPTQIRSEVEIFAGVSEYTARTQDGPPKFPSFRSVMTTTSEITGANGMETVLAVTKTQVRKSALGRLLKPLFNLDDVEFRTERLLSPLKQGATEVIMTTTYLDPLLRVSRNEQGQVFVFVRADDGQLT